MGSVDESPFEVVSSEANGGVSGGSNGGVSGAVSGVSNDAGSIISRTESSSRRVSADGDGA